MKGVIAYGMCLVIISGEIDLSVGSQCSLKRSAGRILSQRDLLRQESCPLSLAR